MDILPGLITNIELGEFLRSGKIVLGCPPAAERVHYMLYRAAKRGIPVLSSMEAAVSAAIRMAKEKFAAGHARYRG